MKKLLALILVLVLSLAALTACSPKETFTTVKDKTVDTFKTVKKTVLGWVGIEVEEEDEETPANYAEGAINFLKSLYPDLEGKTTKSFERMARISVDEGVFVDVVWTTNNSAVTVSEVNEEGMVTVNVPTPGSEDIIYTLTATVTDANGNTESVTYTYTIPSVNTFTTLEEYYAAAKGDTVVIKGIVSGIISEKASGGSENDLYILDESRKGGYYVYKLSEDPVVTKNLKVGMTVKITGEKDKYNNTSHQIKNATLEVLDTSIKTITPVDFTKTFTDAVSAEDTELNSYQGLLVTVKGVELTSLEVSSSGFLYYHFTLDGVDSYMGVSHSNNNCMSVADTDALKAKFDANKGSTADITGIACNYKGTFYIVPTSVDSLSNFKVVERTDAEKAQYELDAIEILNSVKVDTVIDLITKGKVYDDVAITWSSDNTCAEVSEDGKTLTVTIQDELQNVTLTASAKVGDMDPITKTFSLKVYAKPNYVVEKVENPQANTNYKLYLFNAKLGQPLFITGEMDGYNLEALGDVNQAKDFQLVPTEGGYYLAFTKNTQTYYVNLVVSGQYVNVSIELTKSTVYTFDADLKTLVSTQTTSKGTNDYYLGTYDTASKTGVTASSTYYVTGDKAANIGVTQFIVYLVELKDVDTMTDAEKVAAQKEIISVNTKVTQDTTIDLPTASVKGVKVEWSVSENAEIKDGKLYINLEKKARTVTLTATITSGEGETQATDTKVFTFEVPKIPTIVPQGVYEFEVGKGYKLVTKTADGFVYFNGSISSGYLKVDANYLNGVDVYVEYANDEKTAFRMYFMKDGKKQYITSKDNSASTAGFDIVDADKVGDVTWSLGTGNAIVSSLSGRFIASDTNNTRLDIRAYAAGNIGSAQYFTGMLAVMIDTDAIPTTDKVAAEKEALTLGNTEMKASGEIALPAPSKYPDEVTIEWKSDNENVVVADGKLTVSVPADLTASVTVKVTATITAGEGEDMVTDTKEFTVTLVASTPAEKVAAEKDALELPMSEASINTSITLPKAATYSDVKIVWTADNDCVAVVDGKLVVTMPTASVTVKVTATITAGEGEDMATDTKVFDLKLNVPAYTLNVVTNPVANKAYKLYFAQTALGKGLFLDGKTGSKDYYLAGTTDLKLAVDAYLVETEEEGKYNLKIVALDGTVKYVNIVKSGSYVNSLIQDTPATAYTFNATLNTLSAAVGDKNYIIATDKEFDTVSAKPDYYTGLYIVQLVEAICKEHAYTDDCDVNCDVCGAARTDAPHKWASDCDTVCDCGLTRDAEAAHTYTDECDAECVCGATRVAAHKWADECDAECDCGVTREAPHKWTSDCDTSCDCGATRETTAEHDWANDPCDAECVCGATREAPHKWSSDCDTDCECGATRAALAAHAYDGCDDTDCGACGATREAIEHSYSADCDATCNNVGCDNVRDAAAHVDTDGNDVCDRPGCAAELGSITPDVDVDVEDAEN